MGCSPFHASQPSAEIEIRRALGCTIKIYDLKLFGGAFDVLARRSGNFLGFSNFNQNNSKTLPDEIEVRGALGCITTRVHYKIGPSTRVHYGTTRVHYRNIWV